MQILRFILWLMIATAATGSLRVASAAEPIPFPALGASPGEHLKFNIHWMGVPAGSAFMTVRPSPPGEYLLVAGVESIGVVKMLHFIKDELQAGGLLTPQGLSTRYFIKQQQRRDVAKVISYRFDREWGEAVRTQPDEETGYITGITPQVNDLVTGFYALRTCPKLKPDSAIYLPMVDGRKIYEVSVKVGARERLHTPVGWFDTIPLTIVVGNSDLFRLQGSVVVWLTDDARRIPVRVESRIDFKSVAADLVFMNDGRGERREMKGND
ncbi:MAG: DUF3108 domain-containing protein [Magnetococcales bacterium]|nr:DUF3108 domain-containing protein [Magnetococcales bacterium]